MATGRAEILRDPHEIATAAAALAKKYGWQHRLIMLFERVARRGSPERVILRITP